MAYLGSFFGIDGSDNPILEMMISGDAENFVSLAWPLPVPDSEGIRDPSIFYDGTTFWLCGTTEGSLSQNTFSLYSSPAPGVEWTFVANVSTATGGTVNNTFAPEWFIDTDNSVHVIVALNVAGFGYEFQIFELHPTNSGMTTWSTPVMIFYPGGQGGYDPFMVSPAISPSGEYSLFWHDEGGNDIQYATSSTLTGTYTQQSSGNWLGIGTGVEGPCLLLIGSTWYLYFDNSEDQLYTGQEQFITSTDNWATWSAQQNIGQDVAMTKQGTVKFIPFTFPSSIPSQQSFGAVNLNVAGSLSGYIVSPSAQFGVIRFGAARLGAALVPAASQTVDPSAVPSQQSLGTPFIPIPEIGPGYAPSRQALGTVEIAGGNKEVFPAAVATRQAFGTPNVVGPIYPIYAVSPRAVGLPNMAGPISAGFVPSLQSFGTPDLNVAQDIEPAAIASLQAFGSPTINFSKDVAPTAIPSGQSLGTVAMSGAVQYLLPKSIPSKQAFGIPALTGGDGQLTVIVGGITWQGTVLASGGSDTASPVTYEDANPPTITSQTLGRWTLEVDLFDTTGQYAPARGQTILLMENGLNLFAGCIQKVSWQRLLGTVDAIIYHITATDKSGICDRRVVLPTTYPAGSDVAQTILAIVANNLNGEGIVTTPQSVPQDGSLGTLGSDLVCNYETVTTDFNQLATDSGTIWYVDALGVLWFNSFDSLPTAPFSLTENADGSGSSQNYRALQVSATNVGYANQIFAVSNLSVLPGSGSSTGGGAGDGTGSNTETFVLEQGNIGVVFLKSPVDGNFYCYGINVSMPIGALYSITVNGVVQNNLVNVQSPPYPYPTVGSAPQYGPWQWLSNSTTLGATLVGPSGLPTGATVVINYTPYTTNTATGTGEALSPIDPATGGTLGTCGSGIYQLAIQVQNISSIASLNAIAAAELAKRGVLSLQITFQTDKPGLTPGMLLPVNIPKLYLTQSGEPINFLITSMQGIAAPGPLEFGSRFQWEVVAQTDTDLGNWYQWYATLLQNAANPLPVPNYEDATFVLGAGSNIAGGLQVTNPYQVKSTGLLLVEYASAGTPPQDQDLIISFNVNGSPIPGNVRIPGGSSPNTSYAYQFPTTNPLYVFNTATETNIITITVAYEVTGPNPIPASNVSATLRWTF
jgi:hypothetical protein